MAFPQRSLVAALRRRRSHGQLLAIWGAILIPGVAADAASLFKVVLLGDSLTFPVYEYQTWGEQLEAAHPEYEWVFRGHPGATTRTWTTPHPHPALTGHLDATIVHILLGVNDAYSAASVQPGEYLLRITLLAELFGEARVFVTPAYEAFPFASLPGDDLIEQYRRVLQGSAGGPEAVFELGADIAWMSDPELLRDGLHPNQAGHDAMAQAIGEAIGLPVPEPASVFLVAFGLIGFSRCCGSSRGFSGR